MTSTRTVTRVGGTPVSEFRLLPFGRNDADGAVVGGSFAFEFTPAMAARVITNFNATGRRLVIDYEHQSIASLNRRGDGLAPAAGWITGLAVRGDGLWATGVEWTEAAAAALAAGEYGYYSPVLYWRDDTLKEVTGRGPVALTNDPALRGVMRLAAKRGAERGALSEERGNGTPPLVTLSPGHVVTDSNRPHDLSAGVVCVLAGQAFQTPAVVQAQGAKHMDEKILKALGLGAGATDDEAVEAITKFKGGAATAAQATVAAVATALKVGEVKDVDGLVTALRKQTEQATALAGEVATLKTTVSGLRVTALRSEFAALIHGRDHAGKIAPAAEEKYFALFQTDRAMFDQVLADMPAKVTATTVFTGTARSGGADPGAAAPDRKAVITAARRSYADERSAGAVVVCSEGAWVHTALRDAGHAGLTDAEKTELGIKEH